MLNDLVSNSGTCITINSGGNWATLDCGMHFISGARTGFGIYLDGASNVTVKNCMVGNFLYGINLAYAKDNYLRNNAFRGNAEYGIALFSSNSNSIESNTVEDNENSGIVLRESNKNTITRNAVNLNGDNGIFLYSSSNNNVTDNAANSNQYGLWVTDSPSTNRITGNTFCGNAEANVMCTSPQIDDHGNTCAPEGSNSVCASSVTCYAGCAGD